MADLSLSDFSIDLEVAALTGAEDLVEYVLRENATPLGLLEAVRPAEYAGQNSVLEILLSAGADPHCRTSRGDSYMGYAITYGDVTLVKKLLNKGGDPNQMIFERPALVHTASCGYIEIVAILLHDGARIEAWVRYDKRTALSFASQAEPNRIHEYWHSS
jgi:ankyrin repeat protein